jgi:hypothetical protein
MLHCGSCAATWFYAALQQRAALQHIAMQHCAMQQSIVRCNIHSLGMVRCTIDIFNIVSICEHCAEKYDIVLFP